MNYSDFESHIKDKLYNSQTAVDTGYIMDIIDQDQGASKKKKVFGLFVDFNTRYIVDWWFCFCV